MNKKINIAIDGPSGAGKSTIAQAVAKKYDYLFVNTGSLYRAIAYYMLQKEIDVFDEQAVISSWDNTKLELLINGDVLLENKILTSELRSDRVSKIASAIAKYSKIRENVVEILQKLSKNNKGIIMDGRDTTFVVMPDAELKIFLWAEPEIRAERRMFQNKELGYETNFETLLQEIKDRDFQDMNRKINPLHKTKDAILLDSSNLNTEEVIQKILDLIEERVK